MNSTVDTNVLLRLILNDEPAKTVAIKDFLRSPEAKRGAIELHIATVSEIVYVLRSPRHSYSRDEIVRAMEMVLTLPLRMVEADIVRSAIDLYRDAHPDWDDCIVAAYALERSDGRLLSYDKGLRHIPGLSRFEPPVAAS